MDMEPGVIEKKGSTKMQAGVIEKEALGELMDSLMADFKVYAPVRTDRGMALEELAPGVTVELDSPRLPALSLKTLLFPQNEVICSYADGCPSDVPLADEKVVAFATRPCDARALVALDSVFGSDREDPYYQARRKNILVASLACRDPEPTCFCASVGGGPGDAEGSDILVSDLGDALLFRAVSEAGAELMKARAKHFRAATGEESRVAEESASRASSSAGGVDIGGLKEKLEGMFDSPFWDRVHETCLGCGVCTYMCPTCHCFTMYDSGGLRGERIRCWDSCQYPAFTLEASGHNPRSSGRERMRQRVMHKFQYFVENFSRQACVGCGRCVEHCPVNLDLREILTRAREAGS